MNTQTIGEHMIAEMSKDLRWLALKTIVRDPHMPLYRYHVAYMGHDSKRHITNETTGSLEHAIQEELKYLALPYTTEK